MDMIIMIIDYESFIAGVQVGRRLKVADSQRKLPPKPPAPSGLRLVTETGIPIVSEAGEQLITEQQEV